MVLYIQNKLGVFTMDRSSMTILESLNVILEANDLSGSLRIIQIVEEGSPMMVQHQNLLSEHGPLLCNTFMDTAICINYYLGAKTCTSKKTTVLLKRKLTLFIELEFASSLIFFMNMQESHILIWVWKS